MNYHCDYECPSRRRRPAAPTMSEPGESQRHVHEVMGSVQVAGENGEMHNHRFSAVSGEAVAVPGGHVHVLDTRTDFYDEHFHTIFGASGRDVSLGDRHVHDVMAETSTNDGHSHRFRVASQIENPIGQ